VKNILDLEKKYKNDCRFGEGSYKVFKEYAEAKILLILDNQKIGEIKEIKFC
jgi:hypothetical protein